MHRLYIYLKSVMAEKKHNLNEEYLNSLTEEQLEVEMKEWTDDEWEQYYCPEGTMTMEEFYNYVIMRINEEYDKRGWK